MNGFFHQALDLPLGERTPTRWIGWVAAALVAVAVIAAAFASAASTAASREALAPSLVTVLLPAQEGTAPSQDEVARVVAALGAIPGVAFVRPVTAAELGLAGGADPAPIPRFIDVALNPGSPIDLEALGTRVAEIAPDATLAPGDRQPTAQGMAAGFLRNLALAAAAAALAALGLAVAGLTRLSLVLHRETIDLLRQLGADDRYIARQLGQHALGGTLRGGFLGFLSGSLAFLGLMASADGWLPPLALAPLDWLALGVIPPVAALLARFAADLAVRPRLS